jgi:hypothetical protein
MGLKDVCDTIKQIFVGGYSQTRLGFLSILSLLANNSLTRIEKKNIAFFSLSLSHKKSQNTFPQHTPLLSLNHHLAYITITMSLFPQIIALRQEIEEKEREISKLRS